MKYSVTSDNTKRMFANSLIKLLKMKSLEKITVKEIVADCGVNHKTFYYHFQDIYDLIHWMLEKETVAVIAQMDIITEYGDAIRYILNYVKENNYILNCLFGTMGKEQFSIFFYNDFIERIHLIINSHIKENGYTIDGIYVDFLCDFYTKALAGKLIDWLKNKENLPEEKLIEYVIFTLRVSVNALLENADAKK